MGGAGFAGTGGAGLGVTCGAGFGLTGGAGTWAKETLASCIHIDADAIAQMPSVARRKSLLFMCPQRFRIQLAVWTSHLARGGVDRSLWPRLQFTAGAIDHPETPQFWKSEAV